MTDNISQEVFLDVSDDMFVRPMTDFHKKLQEILTTDDINHGN